MRIIDECSKRWNHHFKNNANPPRGFVLGPVEALMFENEVREDMLTRGVYTKEHIEKSFRENKDLALSLDGIPVYRSDRPGISLLLDREGSFALASKMEMNRLNIVKMEPISDTKK